ncbi:MAG: FAD-binding protein [Rhodobacteraceae bacterium]|nr:FAD-binding protein [Paracoccaceae bacterium]
MTLTEELRAALSPGAVLTGPDIPEGARSDASGVGRSLPLLLLRPSSTAEVSAALRICARHGQTVVPQGGMTGLAGGACPAATDVALSLERLDVIAEIDAEASCITLGAGCILQTAQEAAAAAGFQFPVDLGARGSATIGGMIATNAGGVRVIRHGMMRDNLLGLEVVLADGTILSHLAKVRKDNTGYALGQLIAGSEGTLGVITRATLLLHPMPLARETALCALDRFADVLALLALARSELPGLSAFEAMWQGYFALNQQAENLRLFPAPPPFTVILETETSGGPGKSAVLEDLLATAMDRAVITDALIAQSDRDARSFWAVREGHHLDRLLPGLLNLDVSLATGEMGAFADAVATRIAADFPTARVHFFGHVGDGNLHLALHLPQPDARAAHAVEAIAYDTLRAFAGSVSAEHGIGTLKRDWLQHSRSAAEIATMRQLKAALDPRHILNPGKVLPDAD